MTRKPKHHANEWADIDGGMAFVIPTTLLHHRNFLALSPHANKLLLDLGRQYNGFNNGYLATAMTVLKPMGWRSESTVREAQAELMHYSIISRTRRGGRNRCSLFALTFRRINAKEGRPLDVAPGLAPSNAWKSDCEPYAKPSRKKKN